MSNGASTAFCSAAQSPSDGAARTRDEPGIPQEPVIALYYNGTVNDFRSVYAEKAKLDPA
ncbi:MAG TPA: hypothetical protein DDZ68_08630 [Parvularcula sp.]|nr:hypothetical protein [Parvularcula sp.]HBS33227.1 hypothetical protein [Parvularcula sp.]HBS35605.1 hypothetical protein [Parvularcula sp.]